MKIFIVENRSDELISQLVDVWEKSVRTTHLFLTADGIKEIKAYVPQAIKNVKILLIATFDNTPVAFMGIENNKLEMLFIHPDKIGQGIGKKLLLHGIKEFNINEVTVNEQNPKAVGFYEHLGFKTYKRTPLDEAGMSYPLLYMKLT